MDPAAQLPERLQRRLDSWQYNPPKWQHQAYGPLNAYFSLKFPPTHFLVKPQALLRKEMPQSDDDDADDDDADDDHENDDNENDADDASDDCETDESDEGDVDKSFDSIDSHGLSFRLVRAKMPYTDRM